MATVWRWNAPEAISNVRSITSRLVIGTSLFIAVFIVLLALSISYSVHTRAETARFDALKGVVYGILGATDIDSNAQLSVNTASLPDDSLNNFNANLYAEIIANDRSQLWKSNSTVKPLPATVIRPINDWMFEKVTGIDGIDLLRVQYVIAWELANGEELPFIVHVAENVEDLSTQLKRFDRVLWLALLAVAPILPIVQFIMLRVSLKPLRDIGEQIDEIEQGKRDALSDTVPIELESLTSSLNTLLHTERERHTQYKNLLGDLSHNLKTPISVLQNIGEKNSTDGKSILQQTQQMKKSLERYAQRATIRTPRYLSPTIQVRPFIRRITLTLNKLYDSPSVQFTVNVDEQFSVRMDEADLLEVLGNLLENACKYGARHIRINQLKGEAVLIIEDDGPGWPAGDLSQYTKRGIRADTQTSGQGIGLAASDQIIRSYGGELTLARVREGGAQVQLNFSFRC
ncbi:MAG: ATP-binding protein [Granulosicoccus sp.]